MWEEWQHLGEQGADTWWRRQVGKELWEGKRVEAKRQDEREKASVVCFMNDLQEHKTLDERHGYTHRCVFCCKFYKTSATLKGHHTEQTSARVLCAGQDRSAP